MVNPKVHLVKFANELRSEEKSQENLSLFRQLPLRGFRKLLIQHKTRMFKACVSCSSITGVFKDACPVWISFPHYLTFANRQRQNVQAKYVSI